jgi:hypothetical protein
MTCEFPPGLGLVTCPHCHRTMLSTIPGRIPIAECQVSCAHLGPPTGALELVRCETCRGNVRQKVAAHECQAFGRCLPRARHENSSGVAGCVDCPAAIAGAPRAPGQG